MRYYCLAFVPAPEGGYAIFSPDFPEITTQGKDIEEGMDMECVPAWQHWT